MLTLENLNKRYKDQVLLNNVSLDIPPGKYLLGGRNASGKSTLLRLLAGLEPPNSGQIVFSSAHDRAFLASDGIEYPPVLTLSQILSLYIQHGNLDSKRVDTLLAEFALQEYLNTEVKNLSTGTLQKLRLVSAFSSNASWLLLDEPFNALDAAAMEQVKSLIIAEQRSLILVDHAGHIEHSAFTILAIQDALVCIN